MRKKQRALIGCVATCFCFFASSLSGSFLETTTEETINDTNSITVKQVLPSSTVTPTNTISPTLTPMATATPTVTPMPTATPTPTTTPTPTPEPTPEAYVIDFTIPDIKSNLNIRSGPSTDYPIIGKLPVDSYAYLLSIEDGWAKISTGSIKEGYINATYLFTQEEVIALCDSKKLVSATVTVTTLNVRSGPSTDHDVVTKLSKGQTYTVLLEESFDGWIAIQLKNNTIGYVSTEYVKLSYALKTGISLEEIEAQEKAEQEKKAKEQKEKEEQKKKKEAAIEKARITSIPETTRKAMTMTDEELYLFATVIYTEAGDQRYEGMLAVANVILNRIECKQWGSTLEEVLFAPGQFAGAADNLIKRAQKRGIPSSCYKAAREALAGRNNIGDFLYFRMKQNVDFSVFDKFYILEDHVFYKRTW